MAKGRKPAARRKFDGKAWSKAAHVKNKREADKVKRQLKAKGKRVRSIRFGSHCERVVYEAPATPRKKSAAKSKAAPKRRKASTTTRSKGGATQHTFLFG